MAHETTPPNFDCHVPTTTGDGITLRTEGDLINPVGMTSESVELFSSAQLPQLNGLVPTATG